MIHKAKPSNRCEVKTQNRFNLNQQDHLESTIFKIIVKYTKYEALKSGLQAKITLELILH